MKCYPIMYKVDYKRSYITESLWNREREREIKVKEKTIIEARTQVHGKEKTDTRKHTKIKDQLK